MLCVADLTEITGLRLEFKEDSNGNVDVTPDWVKWLWASPRDQLNVTVIDLSPTALKVLSRMKYDRLVSAIPIKNGKVNVHSYKGDVITGAIIDVTKNIIQFKVRAEADVGSPLLNNDLKVVEMHVGLRDTQIESGEVTCQAINVQSILECFKKYVLKSLEGKTENELWLEKIMQIPKEDFHFIGSGGYAKVYKVTIETDLAVKIVRGVGKFNDYEN